MFPAKKTPAVSFLLIGLLFGATVPSRAALPAGFVEEEITGPWTDVVGITFSGDGRMFVWDRGGRVWFFHDDHRELLIDISGEVGGWRDYGLLG